MQVHHVEHKYQGSSDRYRNSTAYLVVHHAAAIYRAGIAALDAVHDYHTQRWGTGVGYHEVLLEEPNGEIGCYVVSDPNLLRFHVAYRNDHAWGISCLTNFADQIPAEKWIQALAERLRVAQKQWPDARVVGHRDIALPHWESPDGKDWRTSCPGMRWPQWKNRLIELVSNASSQPDITRVWEVMRDVAYAAVRTAPSRTAPKALNDTAALPSGAQFEVDAIATGESIGGNNLWAHMAPPNDLGFIHTSIVAPVAQPPSSVIPAVPYTLDETSPVLGPASVQEAQVAAFIKRKGTLYSSVSVDEIVSLYAQTCHDAGVNLVWPMAQLDLEASAQQAGGKWYALSSWWALRPRRNGCGYGVTGRHSQTSPSERVKLVDGVAFPTWAQCDDGTWVEGISFPSWELSAWAHVGRLLAYVLKPGEGDPCQQELIAFALGIRPLAPQHRGTDPAIRSLQGRWAADPEYIEKLLERANALMSFRDK